MQASYCNTAYESTSMNTIELLRLTTTTGRTYLIVNMVDDEIMEIIWQGFTPELIFKAGIDTIADLMIKHHPAGIIFNILDHKSISKESQRYAAAATLEYVKKYFVRTISRQRFKRVIVAPGDVVLPEAEDQPGGYFLRLSESRVETIVLRDMEEVYRVFELQTFQRQSER